MRKTTIGIITAALFLMGCNFADAQAYKSGSHVFHVGYGDAAFDPGTFVSDDAETSILGPINFAYEYAVGDKFGIGVDVGYSDGSAEAAESYSTLDQFGNPIVVEGTSTYSKTKLTLNLRGNVHFGDNDRWDPYLAFGVGYKSVTREYDSVDPDYDAELENIVPVAMLLRFGTRLMFSDNFGAFVEGGIGHGYAQGGLVMKF